MKKELTQRDEQNGFIKDGFGGVARKVEALKVYIVFDPRLLTENNKYGVYISHGVAGGAFWRNSAPLCRKNSLEDAKEVAEEIFGIYGSGDFAEIIEDYR